VKLKHWLVIALVLVGALFVGHLIMSHGGIAGFKQGIGLGG
jgi:hypothetical protein